MAGAMVYEKNYANSFQISRLRAYDHSTQSTVDIPQLEWKSAFRKISVMQSNSQYDRISPSFFADRRLDGLLCPVLVGIVCRYCVFSSWLVAALLCDSLLGGVYPRW
jgi:hypothetical protein